MPISDELAGRLGANITALREARGMTQQQISKLAGLPRATWAHLESGAANPTLQVLHRAASALSVSLEEIIAPPRASAKHFPAAEIQEKRRGTVTVRKLLPDPIPGMDLDRMELPPKSRMLGVPHTAGTTEYLTCERGTIVLIASGESYTLATGDVVVFRGDQKHSYENPEDRTAIGYSVVVLARTSQLG